MAASLPAARRKALATRLRDLNRELALESRKREDAARVFELDLEFHRSYVEGVVGPRLLTLHRAIKPQSERYSRLYVTVLLDELSASVKEHEAIAAASRRAIRTPHSALRKPTGTTPPDASPTSSRSTASAEAGPPGTRAVIRVVPRGGRARCASSQHCRTKCIPSCGIWYTDVVYRPTPTGATNGSR